MSRSAAQEVRVIVHCRVAILYAQRANGVNQFRRKLVHHRGNQLGSTHLVGGGGGAGLYQANHFGLLLLSKAVWMVGYISTVVPLLSKVAASMPNANYS